MKKHKEELKAYRVIFNGDYNNYEEFEDLEKAEIFASRYVGAKIKLNFEQDEPKKNKKKKKARIFFKKIEQITGRNIDLKTYVCYRY